jgi:hypothetical protein
MNLEKFIETIKQLFWNAEIEEQEESQSLLFNYKGVVLNLNYERILTVLNKYTRMRSEGDTTLLDNNSYEILVSFESRRPYPIGIFENFSVEDNQNKLLYELGQASEEYLIFMLEKLYDSGLIKDYRRRFMIPHTVLMDRAEKMTDFFDFLRLMMRRLITLKIKSETSKTAKDFEVLNTSFLFHIAYTIKLPILEIKSLDEYVSIERFERIRRNEENIDPPRRTYISDLVHHYQMAISTESPFLQYISFYHILEHFYEKVYNDELIKLIQNEITSPSFSAKRENDIKKVIKVISTKLLSRNEEYSIDEKEALQITLMRYVNMENVKCKIKEIDSSLIEYYKKNDVVFSGGQKVNFDDKEIKGLFKNVASRIYLTRNSIVHSKDTDKPRYMPFKHDKSLVKEIPLIRFIAEEIIINTSEML